MANEIVLKDPQFEANSVDLSEWVKQLAITYEADAPEKTASGDDPREYLPGLKRWAMTLTLNQDRGAAAVDATLFPLVGTAFTVKARAVAAGVSSTNPSYEGTVILTSYQPIGGAIGEVENTTINLQGTGILDRATSS